MDHLGRVRHRIHELHHGLTHHAQGEKDDDETDGKSSVAVGGGHLLGAEVREEHGRERDDSREVIDDVVPGVGHQRGAACPAAVTELHHAKPGLYDDRSQERPGGVQRGRMVVGLLNRFHADAGAGGDQQHSNGESREDLEAAVAVGVLLIGRLRGNPKAEQDETGGEEVGGRFEAVRDDRDGARRQAHHDLHHGEEGARGHACQRDAPGKGFRPPHALRLR